MRISAQALIQDIHYYSEIKEMYLKAYYGEEEFYKLKFDEDSKEKKEQVESTSKK